MTFAAVKNRHICSPTKTAILSILLALLVGGVAVTNQSLWIDEASSAAKAAQPSLRDWWAKYVAEKGSDLQMPLYMFYLWAWCKAVGTSELALRAANLPWFAAGIWALRWSVEGKRQLQLTITALALINASLWYYISEARPYIVLFAFSAITAACLFRLKENWNHSIEPVHCFPLLCLGIVGICATNLIAVPLAIAALGGFTFWIGPRAAFRTATRFAWSSGLLMITLGALALYYIWTLRLGARASDVGRTGFANLVFVSYELLGLSGLGPGRIILREEGAHSFSAYALPVGVGLIAVSSLVLAAVAELRSKTTRRDVIFFAILVGFPVAALMLFGFAVHMRLLGRHFTSLLPFLLMLVALGLRQLLFGTHKLARAVGIGAIAILLISALEIRFAPRHRRDDYRSATSIARAAIATGKKVWWLADETAGAYYNLPLNSPNLVSTSNLLRHPVKSLPPPDLVCLSKPDIYDPDAEIRNYVREHDFTLKRMLPAFQIFDRASQHSQAH